MERVLKFVGTFSAGAAAGYYFHYDAKKEKNYDKRELWKQELMERSYDDNDLLKLYDKTSEEIVEQLHSLRTADETFFISPFKVSKIKKKRQMYVMIYARMRLKKKIIFVKVSGVRCQHKCAYLFYAQPILSMYALPYVALYFVMSIVYRITYLKSQLSYLPSRS